MFRWLNHQSVYSGRLAILARVGHCGRFRACILVVRNSIAGQPTSAQAVIALIVLGVLGLLFVPAAIGGLVYDNHTGNIKGWSYIAAADVLGLVFLIVAVVVGVNVYG